MQRQTVLALVGAVYTYEVSKAVYNYVSRVLLTDGIFQKFYWLVFQFSKVLQPGSRNVHLLSCYDSMEAN